MKISLGIVVASALVMTVACGGDDDGDQETSPGDAQTPARGADQMEDWLEGGAYLEWAAEPAIHEARSPSPHGFNRIFVNDLLAQNAGGSSDWPAGVAAVKELYDSADAAEPVGYAVYLKTAADSDGGRNWYWYEIVPDDSPAPHDENGIVADGLGTDGPARSICVGCHALAGADEAHTPTAGGRDLVYSPVSADGARADGAR
jgi:hypothetical protein